MNNPIATVFASLGCTALGILAIFVILTLIRRHKAKKKGGKRER